VIRTVLEDMGLQGSVTPCKLRRSGTILKKDIKYVSFTS